MRKSIIGTLLVPLLVTLASCQPEQQQAQSEETQEPRTAVDLILSNGKIVTVDEAFTIADTVVVNEDGLNQLFSPIFKCRHFPKSEPRMTRIYTNEADGMGDYLLRDALKS